MKNHGIYSLTARHNSKYGVVFFVNINPYYTKTEEVTSYVLFLTLKIRVSTSHWNLEVFLGLVNVWHEHEPLVCIRYINQLVVDKCLDASFNLVLCQLSCL